MSEAKPPRPDLCRCFLGCVTRHLPQNVLYCERVYCLGSCHFPCDRGKIGDGLGSAVLASPCNRPGCFFRRPKRSAQSSGVQARSQKNVTRLMSVGRPEKGADTHCSAARASSASTQEKSADPAPFICAKLTRALPVDDTRLTCRPSSMDDNTTLGMQEQTLLSTFCSPPFPTRKSLLSEKLYYSTHKRVQAHSNVISHLVRYGLHSPQTPIMQPANRKTLSSRVRGDLCVL
jgi:hypothetical protein